MDWTEVLDQLLADEPTASEPAAILAVLDRFVDALNGLPWLRASLDVHGGGSAAALIVAPKSRYDTLVVTENLRVNASGVFLGETPVPSAAHLAARFLLDVAPGGKYPRLRAELEPLEAETLLLERGPVALAIPPAERRRCFEQLRAGSDGVTVEALIPRDVRVAPSAQFRAGLAHVALAFEVLAVEGDIARLRVWPTRRPFHRLHRGVRAVDLPLA